MEGMSDEFWKLIGVGFTVLSVWSGLLVWAVTRLLNKYEAYTDKLVAQTQGYLVTQLDEVTASISALMEKIETVKGDQETHRFDSANNYVSRHDWIRFSGQIDKKLDKLWQLFTDLSNRQDQ